MVIQNASQAQASGNEWPLVSVILPVRNELGYLEATLEALAKQVYPPEQLEIVIVDDHSTDVTLDRLRDLATQLLGSIRWVVLGNEGNGVAAARRTAISRANGDLLVNFSAHAIPRPNYIITLVLRLSSSRDITAVGCRFLPYPNDPPFSKAIVSAMTSTLGGYRTSHYWSQREGVVPSVTFAMIRREGIAKVGGYPNGDDRELNSLFAKARLRLYNTRETTVFYRFKRGSPTEFLSRMAEYGRLRSGQFYGRFSKGGLTYALPAAIMVVAVALVLFSALSRTYYGLEILGGLALLYVIAILAEVFTCVKQGAGREVVYLLAIFPMIHFGYGAGYLQGLVTRSPLKFNDDP